ncbi:Tim44 domain-containing protein [Ramlibacter tataouinensis]|uniref:Tim44 domain-containing protein n=1 Tax=Ramlibacter tataouinensis TaxID=94132 RepID=UPI003F7E57A5
MKLSTAVLVGVLALSTSLEADARRMGGGGSFGRQSPNVTQREAAKPPPQQGPAQNAGQQQAGQQPAQAAQARPGAANTAAPAARSRWGGILGGLAAGLGLAWLANALGFGPALAQFMLFALLALVIMVAVGFLMRRRAPASAGRSMGWQGGPELATAPRQYSPDKVGNDASARPWESGSMAFDAGKPAGSGLQIGSALGGSQNWGVPAGFDTDGFVNAAKRNFHTLQDAWDRSDIGTLRSMMTDEMLAEIRQQLAEREKHASGEPNKTEVLMLQAQMLGIEDLGDAYMASVEFSGMIREQPSAGPSPFREVWNMTKPKNGASGWLVAGLQALQ